VCEGVLIYLLTDCMACDDRSLSLCLVQCLVSRFQCLVSRFLRF